MKCGHTTDGHKCQSCGQCNACKHIYVLRADGLWYKRCPNLKWHKAQALPLHNLS
jgi:hypothetical protein